MGNFTFTTPKICDYKGDPTKHWFIYFRAKESPSSEPKLFQYKLGINRTKKKSEKRVAAKAALKTINDLLSEGFNPFTKSIDQVENKLIKSLELMLDIKNASIRNRTRQIYANALMNFTKWCNKYGYDALKPNEFTKKEALLYLDYMQKEKGLSGKTCNNMMGYIKTLFFMLKERGMTDDNPFCYIKKCKEASGVNVAFTPNEIEKITSYMKVNHKRLYFATQFVRYAFLRRTELMGLKVGMINLRSHTITIPANVSKNGRTDSVTIPISLEKIILEMGLENANPDHYVFGQFFQTCGRKFARIHDFSDDHRDIVTELKMRKELIFYGWKHTGCVELYNKTKDPYVVSRQCRHSDIKITMRYLRSLGLGFNEVVRDW